MSHADTPVAMPLPPPSARSLLLTVMGELAYPDDEAVWTTVLIRVLGGLGVESHAVRQAINRSAAAGWLDSERQGRAVRWRLAAPGRAVVEDGLKRAAEYLARPAARRRWEELMREAEPGADAGAGADASLASRNPATSARRSCSSARPRPRG